MRSNFLFAITIATINLIVMALTQFLTVYLAVADPLRELGLVLFHGLHARHD